MTTSGNLQSGGDYISTGNILLNNDGLDTQIQVATPSMNIYVKPNKEDTSHSLWDIDALIKKAPLCSQFNENQDPNSSITNSETCKCINSNYTMGEGKNISQNECMLRYFDSTVERQSSDNSDMTKNSEKCQPTYPYSGEIFDSDSFHNSMDSAYTSSSRIKLTCKPEDTTILQDDIMKSPSTNNSIGIKNKIPLWKSISPIQCFPLVDASFNNYSDLYPSSFNSISPSNELSSCFDINDNSLEYQQYHSKNNSYYAASVNCNHQSDSMLSYRGDMNRFLHKPTSKNNIQCFDSTYDWNIPPARRKFVPITGYQSEYQIHHDSGNNDSTSNFHSLANLFPVIDDHFCSTSYMQDNQDFNSLNGISNPSFLHLDKVMQGMTYEPSSSSLSLHSQLCSSGFGKGFNPKVSLKSAKNRPLHDMAINVLETWWCENQQFPYPTQIEKLKISEKANISIDQVKSWFANKRNRTNSTRPKKNLQRLKANLSRLCYDLESASKGLVKASYISRRFKDLLDQCTK